MNKTLIIVVCLSVLVAACSPMFDVSYTHDPEATFKAYATYNLMDNEAFALTPSAEQEFAGRRQMMQEELVKALNKYIQAEGLVLDEKDPDILVAYYVGVRDEIFAAQYGFDYNDQSGAAVTQTVQDGAMRVDFVDTETKKVVWSGSGHGAVNRDPTEDMIRQNIDRAVKKLIEQYPPTKSPYTR
jgi:hypothetical protein